MNILKTTILLVLSTMLLPSRGSVAQTDAAQMLYLEGVRLEENGQHDLARLRFIEIVTRYPGSEWARQAATRLRPNALLTSATLQDSGPSGNRIDVAILGDGFRRNPKEQRLFNALARSAAERLFSEPTLRAYRRYFNIHRVNLASRKRTIPLDGRIAASALAARRVSKSYGYVTVDPARVHAYLATQDWNDRLAVVLVRAARLGCGGLGIAVCSGKARELTHEWGHAFAGLGDEYVESNGHGRAWKGWPNLARDPDPAKVPWAHWIARREPKVGVFPGGNGGLDGVWRPTPGTCAMAGFKDFCAVCREQVVLAVYGVVSPIDRATATGAVVTVPAGGTAEFFVETLRPEGHALEVEWRIASGPSAGDVEVVPTFGHRGARPPFRRRAPRELPPFRGDRLPVASAGEETEVGTVRHTLHVRTEGLKPGPYVISLRVADPTPWVVKDPLHLLEERRVYRMEVTPRR
jgi:hypothetical protein